MSVEVSVPRNIGCLTIAKLEKLAEALHIACGVRPDRIVMTHEQLDDLKTDVEWRARPKPDFSKSLQIAGMEVAIAAPLSEIPHRDREPLS